MLALSFFSNYLQPQPRLKPVCPPPFPQPQQRRTARIGSKQPQLQSLSIIPLIQPFPHRQIISKIISK